WHVDLIGQDGRQHAGVHQASDFRVHWVWSGGSRQLHGGGQLDASNRYVLSGGGCRWPYLESASADRRHRRKYDLVLLGRPWMGDEPHVGDRRWRDHQLLHHDGGSVAVS